MSDAIKALATNMVGRKRSETDPYILFLGAGASISSGCSSMVQIVDDVLQSQDSTQFNDWQREIEKAASKDSEFGELKRQEIGKQKRGRFFEIWSRLDHDSQYAILMQHLWENKSPSDGYSDLAYLIKMGYIKMVLSTNLDNLLEKALNNIDWYQPDNFIVVVNGKDSSDEVHEQLESSRAPFKLIKLHGTLESPGSYAFTPEEVFDFEKTIKPSLSRIMNQSLIVIGHSMQDRDIDMLFDDEGKEIHFVKPTRPETESRIDTILKVRRQGSIIEGDDGKFDDFFRKLQSCIEQESDEISIRDSIPSIERFLRSIGYERELEVPRSRFRSLPTLYVKPTEYDDICSKLEREHVVFIIGEPHLGKTYTAFHLLWEYYQKDYETLHIRHDRLVTLLHKHDGDMKKLLIDLLDSETELPHVIHFDDPFGETTERRTDAFAKGLDTFLDLVRGYEHLRVIVTTRLNIFRESLSEIHDRKNVEKLEEDIRVHTSYRRDVLLDILHRYTHFYNPLWATDEKIIAALDEQLPDLLPAPHNIEFFVRTSERLNSLEEVLRHVESSKEMVKALGEWMGHLPDHEQLFLLWLEVCSTTGILFPDSPASKMDFERAYMETLAYMFKRKHIAGIPTSPLSRAKDKFDMILIESRDKESDLVKYDFIHPSYHEAFWYAIQHKLPLHRWWELLKENAGEILDDLKNKVDMVQLRMIERYGTINRDLDQLLLLSAESDDVNEQSIALEHMLERPEQFIDLPQFSLCARSVIGSGGPKHRYNFLNSVDNYFDQLPIEVMKAVLPSLFDTNPKIGIRAKKIILKYFDTLPESVKQSWRIANDIFYPSEEELSLDSIDSKITSSAMKNAIFEKMKVSEELISRFVKISPADLQLLLKLEHTPPLIISTILESYEKLSQEQRDVFLAAKSSPRVAKALKNYIDESRHSFKGLSDSVLIDLLSSLGTVQYFVLPELLIRFKQLSNEAKLIVNELINTPTDWWVGGSIGQTASKKFENKLSKEVKDLCVMLSNHPDKRVVGAMLAEMAQAHWSSDMGLQEMYEPTLYELSRDTEAVRYAEVWMDHQLESFGFPDKEYWSKVKSHLRNLSEKDGLTE